MHNQEKFSITASEMNSFIFLLYGLSKTKDNEDIRPILDLLIKIYEKGGQNA